MFTSKPSSTQPRRTIKAILEEVIDEMVVKGIFWSEASAQFEKLFIISALRKSRGNIRQAARLMRVHRNTLSKKVREYGIDRSKLRRSDGRP
jgi:DNA-binding NtrC family response regulator